MATAEPSAPPAGDTAYLYRAALGERAQDYYLRQFARFDSEGRAGTSWNWAAYWATLNWLIYRRMWGWALAYVAALAGLALLIFGVGKLLLDYSATSAWLLFLGLLTAAFVVPGLYANAWLYHHLNERISAALRDTQDVKAAATALAAQAPGQRRLLLIALANAVLLALAVLLAQAFDGSGAALPQQAAVPDDRMAAAAAAGASPAAAMSAAAAASAPAAPTGTAAAAEAAGAAPAVAAAASAPQEPASAPQAAAGVAAAPAQAASVVAAPAATPARRETAAEAGRLAQPSPPSGAPAQPAAARASGGAPAIEPAAALTRRASAAVPPAVAARPPAAAASAPAPERRAPPRHVWVIQVGAYADAANAERALAQVQGLGLEAGAESFDTAGKGRLTRVRVGPFTRQAEAEQAALRIKALDLPVLVIRQRP